MSGRWSFSIVRVTGLFLAFTIGTIPLASATASPNGHVDGSNAMWRGNSAAPGQATEAKRNSSAVATIAEGDADWWSTVQDQIRQSEYHVTWQEQTYLNDVPAAYQAPNRAQNFRTYFTPSGPIIIPRVWPDGIVTPPWRWEIRLVAWGREGALQPASAAVLEAQDNLIGYQRHAVPAGPPTTNLAAALEPETEYNLVERYQNEQDGIQQGLYSAVSATGRTRGATAAVRSSSGRRSGP